VIRTLESKVKRVFAEAMASGTVSAIGGGKFSNGARTGAFMATMKIMPEIYEDVVGYKADWHAGGAVQYKDDKTKPIEGANNIGTQGGGRIIIDGVPYESVTISVVNDEGVVVTLTSIQKSDCFVCEGSRLSTTLNKVPGINAVAGMHDMFQISYPNDFLRNVFNVPGMPVAGALTAFSFAGQAFNSFNLATGDYMKYTAHAR
jgi:hypothetical protein